MPYATQDLKDIIINDATRLQLDPALMLSLADHESGGFNPNALSPTGVQGLFQVTNATGAPYGQTPQTRTDPQISSDVGQRHFKDLLGKARGDVPTALRWYNGRSDPQFAERVLAKYPAHQASLTQEPNADTILQQVYGSPQPALPASTSTPAEPSADAILQQVYPPPVAAPPAPPAKLDARDVPLPPAAAALGSEYAIPGMTPREIEGVSKQTTAMGIRTGLTVGGQYLAGTPGAIAGGVAANRLIPALGLEKPEQPFTTVQGVPITLGDTLAVALPLVTAGGSAGVRAWLRNGPVGSAIQEAEEATEAARQTWQKAADKVFEAQQKGDVSAADLAMKEAQGAQKDYRTALNAYNTQVATATTHHEGQQAALYADALKRGTAAQKDYRDAMTAYNKAVAKANEAHAQGQDDLYAQAVKEVGATSKAYQKALGDHTHAQQTLEDYDLAVKGQARTLDTARGMSTKYAPETPSWTLYEKFGEVASKAPVDMEGARKAVQDILANRGTLPTGEPLPLPGVMQKFVDAITGAGNTVDVRTVQQQLRALGPLTRSPNGNIRGLAKQLYGAYGDALEQTAAQIPETAGAHALMKQANATFRKEMALQDLSDWLVPGHGVVRVDGQGRQAINVGALLTRLEKHIQSDALFAKSFTPEELQSLRQDLYGLAGSPAMPRGGAPTVPPMTTQAPEHLPGSYQGRFAGPPEMPQRPTPPGPIPVGSLPPPPLPEGRPLPPHALPGSASAPTGPMPGQVPPLRLADPTSVGQPPGAVPATVTRPPLQPSLRTILELVGLGSAHPGLATKAAASIVGGSQLNYLLAKALLTPALRPAVVRAIEQGVIPPELQAVLSSALTEGGKRLRPAESP